MSNSMKFNYTARDENHWEALDKIFSSEKYKAEDILTNWPAYVKRRHISRFLAHYELVKKTLDLPGSIVELGVFKGASFFSWSKL